MIAGGKSRELFEDNNQIEWGSQQMIVDIAWKDVCSCGDLGKRNG